MEAKVHKELLSFLSQHNLEESVSNIDEIILSYLAGVVELVSQGDDGLDIVELMEMMNAYLPGFDQIGRSEVIDWMFGLASKLMGSSKENCQESSYKESYGTPEEDSNEDKVSIHDIQSSVQDQVPQERKFPSYNYFEKSSGESLQKECNENLGLITFVSSSSSTTVPSTAFPQSHHPDNASQPFRSKRKGRQLSCSSQDSQEDTIKADHLELRETQVRMLLEMFPAACTMEAHHCLQLSAGDMDRAAQLIIDRQETGQAIMGQSKSKVTKKNYKMKKIMDYKLDDDSIKSCVLEKYSFVDTEEDKKTYRPPPPKGEAKKLVRYRDGIVVSMKGERYSEVKTKEEGEEVKATYVNLKPARKYRFH